MPTLLDDLIQQTPTEKHRLEILRLLGVLDTPAEPIYDELTQLASEICQTQIALISLVDECRQWFKAKRGLDATETPREVAFCSIAIQQDTPLVVNDATLDPRFKNNPLVIGAPYIRFYAGAPLCVGRLRIGTLCVIDYKARNLTAQQIRSLEILANQVVAVMELRHREKLRQEAESLLAMHKLQIIASSKMSALGEMASGIAHEINNPLAAIMARAGQLIDIADQPVPHSEQIRHAGKVIESTCHRIARTVRALRTFARDDEDEPLEKVSLEEIFNDTLSLCGEKFKTEVTLDVQIKSVESLVKCHPVQISQVLINLLSNAYDAAIESSEKWVKLECKIKGTEVEISVSDSGKGVPKDLREKVLEPFFTTKPVGKGTGLGLSISQRILQAHGSELCFDDQSPRTRIFFRLSTV